MRGALVLAILAVSAPAFADDDTDVATTHKGQVGISARFGFGFRGIKPYNSTVYCGQTDVTAANGNAPLCTGRTPFRIDLEAAYGVAAHVELLFELRLGLERDFGAAPGLEGPRPLHISPGARFFFGEGKHTQLFVTAQLAVDLSDYSQASGADFGVRSLEGVWIDLHKTYGIYFFIGETLEVKRWLSGEFEGGIGFQGRYP